MQKAPGIQQAPNEQCSLSPGRGLPLSQWSEGLRNLQPQQGQQPGGEGPTAPSRPAFLLRGGWGGEGLRGHGSLSILLDYGRASLAHRRPTTRPERGWSRVRSPQGGGALGRPSLPCSMWGWRSTVGEGLGPEAGGQPSFLQPVLGAWAAADRLGFGNGGPALWPPPLAAGRDFRPASSLPSKHLTLLGRELAGPSQGLRSYKCSLPLVCRVSSMPRLPVIPWFLK